MVEAGCLPTIEKFLTSKKVELRIQGAHVAALLSRNGKSRLPYRALDRFARVRLTYS